jgi:hypothetical protein
MRRFRIAPLTAGAKWRGQPDGSVTLEFDDVNVRAVLGALYVNIRALEDQCREWAAGGGTPLSEREASLVTRAAGQMTTPGSLDGQSALTITPPKVANGVTGITGGAPPMISPPVMLPPGVKPPPAPLSGGVISHGSALPAGGGAPHAPILPQPAMLAPPAPPQPSFPQQPAAFQQLGAFQQPSFSQPSGAFQQPSFSQPSEAPPPRQGPSRIGPVAVSQIVKSVPQPPAPPAPPAPPSPEASQPPETQNPKPSSPPQFVEPVVAQVSGPKFLDPAVVAAGIKKQWTDEGVPVNPETGEPLISAKLEPLPQPGILAPPAPPPVSRRILLPNGTPAAGVASGVGPTERLVLDANGTPIGLPAESPAP